MAKYISKLINGEELYYLKDSEARTNKADKSATVSTVSYDTTNKKITKTINGTTSDVVTAAKIVTDGGGITSHQNISGKVDKTTTVNGHALSSNVTVTKSDVGLGNVTNDAQVKRSEMGAASGVATLDSAGKVPSSQLPSYVDDVLEYDTKSDFPTTGEAGKIYVDKSTNTTWRWSGSAYTQIKGDLAIGTTTGTAADGGVANTHYNNKSNPHSVTKAQVGLGSVVNTGDSATPVSGGTTKFTTGGAYTELNKKVDKVSGKGLSTNDYTTDEKNKLSGIASGAQANVIETVKVNGTALTPSSKAVDVTVPTKTSELTNNSNFVSDASYVHTDNNYTATEKSKLSGIASGAEVNQNAFSNIGVKVGSTTTTVAADAKTDTITLIQGSNITLTPDATNDTVTIAATDTKYTAATAAPGKVATSSAQGSSTNYARQDHTHGIDLATGDSNGQVKIAGTNVSVKGLGSAAYTASTAYATNQQLASDANLNNIKTVGFYNAGGGNTITNKPSGVEHFGMEVIHYASGDYYVQIVYNNSNSWRRRCDNGTWGSWVQDKLTDTTYSAATTSAAGLMSANDKTKLNGIATGATKVTTDTVSGWGYTKNTGTVTSVAVKMNGASKGTVTTSGTIDLGTVLTSHQDISGKADKTTTVNGHALSSNVTVTKSDVGLGNVTNDSLVKRSEMGAASGVATLDSNGKVPSSQLPSYVDDVIEGYFYNSKFYKESGHTTEITGETGKIYVDLSTNKTYRWGGSAYAVISETLALGETSSTAYRGDRGKTAYTHSQTTSGNPHNVTKSDVGLGNVGNFKAVSTVASQGLTDTEKSNARTNIGAGTSSFSGSYNDLSNKPTIPAAAANGTYTVKTLVGSTTTNVSDFTANQSSADDVTFVQGSNVTITPDATNRKITIAAKDTTYGVVSTSANGLAPKVTDTSKFLKGDGTWATPTDTNNRKSFYGTCDTAADTAAKVVTISDTDGWELKAGTIVGIKFTYTNTASNVTLNVNSSGAKSIWYNNAAYTGNSNAICGYANRVTYYMYDGTQWVWLNMGSLDGNTDTKVTQTATTTSADYEVLFSATADNTTRTEAARKNSNLKFNPSTGNLQATQLNGVTIGSSPKFTDTTYSSKEAASGGTDVSLVTTGEKAIWNAKTSNTGTITGIKMNGASKGTSGVVDLGTVITSLNHTVTVQSGLKSDGTTTISGTSSSAGSPTVALGDSGVTAGTYKRVTVNAKGIVIGGDNTDSNTLNTAGTTNKTGTKMFLAAATEQSANPVTYSNSNCYIGTDNCLYSGGAKVLTNYTNTTYAAGTGVTISGSNNAINVTYGTAANTACQGNDSRLSNARPASDVSAWAKASSKPSYAYSEIGYTVNAISSSGGSVSLAGTTPLHVVTLTGNVSALTLSANPAEGHSCHVIFTAAAKQTVAIAHDATSRVCPGAEDISIEIPAGGYAEIDFLTANGKVYVRGV